MIMRAFAEGRMGTVRAGKILGRYRLQPIVHLALESAPGVDLMA